MCNDKYERRHSKCSNCGKRLTIKTLMGEFRWLLNFLTSDGRLCDECFEERIDKKYDVLTETIITRR
jgi:hypothetical protein